MIPATTFSVRELGHRFWIAQSGEYRSVKKERTSFVFSSVHKRLSHDSKMKPRAKNTGCQSRFVVKVFHQRVRMHHGKGWSALVEISWNHNHDTETAVQQAVQLHLLGNEVACIAWPRTFARMCQMPKSDSAVYCFQSIFTVHLLWCQWMCINRCEMCAIFHHWCSIDLISICSLMSWGKNRKMALLYIPSRFGHKWKRN